MVKKTADSKAAVKTVTPGSEKQGFDNDKKNALEKEDKSNRGHWDQKIVPLCEAINSKPDFYTSSSCSGRMVLLSIPKIGTKADAKWLFTSHDRFTFDQLKPSIDDLPEEQVVYRYEPFILHVVCRDLESADRLLRAVRDLGLKRCGIISLSKKITVEIIGTANISTLISDNGRLLVTEGYLKTVIGTSNVLLEQNWRLIEMIMLTVKNKL